MQQPTEFQQVILDKSLWWRLRWPLATAQIELSDRLKDWLRLSTCNELDFVACLTAKSQSALQEQFDIFEKGQVTTAKLVVEIQATDPTWLLMELQRVDQIDGLWLVAMCTDVSDLSTLMPTVEDNQKQAAPSEKQADTDGLQQQFHDQTQFLAMLSHELRSPLMGLNSMLNIVKQKLTVKQHQKVAEELKVMKMTIDQLNFLINDILTYAQTEFNQIRLNPSVFDLHEMADYICHLTKSIASEKGIDVRFSVSTQNDCFYGDLVRLSQVLVNLIVNAIKFTEQGGVEVVILEEDEFIEFHVKDSGEGIEEAELATIFTPFKQLDSRGGEQYVGSGLGLSIVKTLVDLMGGVLEVKSERGQGTDFSFVIPMRSGGCPDPTFITLEPTPVNSVALCDFHILIADDSAINRKVMQTFLAEMGCQVDEAEDGTQAWQKFQQQDYDYVFLDIQMPGLNGMEVCQKMRTFQQHNAHPVKGIFALTAAHTVAEVADTGTDIDKSLFDAWLEKPASQDKIIHLLHCQSNSVVDGLHQVPSLSEAKTAKKAVESSASTVIPEELIPLVPQLKDNIEQDLAAIYHALHHENGTEAKAILHRLKGNLMLFELTESVNLVRNIESLVQTKKSQEIEILLKKLEKNLYDTYKPYL